MNHGPEKSENIKPEQDLSAFKAQATPEEKERVLKALIKEMLLHNAEQINEGNNGIIYRTNLELTPGLKDALTQVHGPIKNESAVKILKVYVPGTATKEVAMQNTAHEILENNRHKNLISQVPEILSHYDIEFDESNPEDAEFLKNIRTKAPTIKNRVEVILMDLVPGEDLATILYREALNHIYRQALEKEKREQSAPELRYFPKDPQNMNFEELQNAVRGAIGYVEPKVKTPETERIAERENHDNLMRHLSRIGFRLDPEIGNQIETTIKIFHDNNFALRDGHPRNIMVVGDYHHRENKSERPRVFFIDYGSATVFQGDYDPSRIYKSDQAGEEGEYVHDEESIALIKKLVSEESSLDKSNRELQEQLTTYEKNPNWQSYYTKILVSEEYQASSSMAAHTAWDMRKHMRGQINEQTNGFVAAVMKLANEKIIDPEITIKIVINPRIKDIDAIRSKKKRDEMRYEKTRLEKLVRWLKTKKRPEKTPLQD